MNYNRQDRQFRRFEEYDKPASMISATSVAGSKMSHLLEIDENSES
jgi:hypothetical protein